MTGIKPEAPAATTAAAAPATPAVPAAPAPAAPKYKCSHCLDTGKIMHGGEQKCPWCSGGDQALKGSK